MEQGPTTTMSLSEVPLMTEAISLRDLVTVAREDGSCAVC